MQPIVATALAAFLIAWPLSPARAQLQTPPPAVLQPAPDEAEQQPATQSEARTQPPSAAPAQAFPPPAPPLRAADPEDLADYVDGMVQGYMRQTGIAGVTVAVVDRQGPLLLRGYGIAAQPDRPVDPERTLFRIGSVSKTFTYLAALKLIDAGRIKLDDEVNAHLPPALKLPDDGRAPVRVRHLLTHTAGYEDSALGHLFVDAPEKVTSLQDYLANHRPARARAPGRRAVYSNYSVALLGALVAQVEGLPFEQLIERDLLAPMAMAHTTFREPLTATDPRNVGDALKGLWSTGFKRETGGFAAQKFEHIAQVGPAGAASSTAADMARYLRMLLGRGTLDGIRVLPESAFARLEGDPLFRNAKEVPGFAYGFFRRRYGQVQSLEHGGATLWFHSGFVAVPELGFGVFVSSNTDTGRKFAAELPRLLLERYFARARAAPPPAPPRDFAQAGQRFAGDYLTARRGYAGLEKLLLSSVAKLAPTRDDYLAMTIEGDTTRWVQEAPLSFREVEGQGRLHFFAARDGRITGFASPGGHNAFDRVTLLQTPNVLLALLALAAITALFVLTGAWLRRLRTIRSTFVARRSARVLYFTAFVWLVFLILFGIVFAQMSGAGAEAIYGYPGALLTAALWVGVVAMGFTAICILLLWPTWRAPGWGFWRKLRHTAAVAVFALTGWVLWTWNAVGWKV